MKKLQTIQKFCPICLKKHEIALVEINQSDIFLNQKISYDAQYDYCEITDQYWSDQELLKENSIRLKDAYRKVHGLLTSNQIIAIRKKYQISQELLSKVLGWGAKTITRYETVSIQDRVHDDVLRKISEDPIWFFDFVQRYADHNNNKNLRKITGNIVDLASISSYEISEKSLLLSYYPFPVDDRVGNTALNIEKVQQVLNYYAFKCEGLSNYKAALLLSLADFTHYQNHSKGLTGLAYISKDNRLYPFGFKEISGLKGIKTKEILEKDITYDTLDYNKAFDIKALQHEEIRTLDYVLDTYKDKSAEKINDLLKGLLKIQELTQDTRVIYPRD
jgi:putative zinc finger/helix-turn-helix YgiT family protein